MWGYYMVISMARSTLMNEVAPTWGKACQMKGAVSPCLLFHSRNQKFWIGRRFF